MKKYAFALIALLSISACTETVDDGRTRYDVKLVSNEELAAEIVIKTEIAATPEERSIGLMHRETLPDGYGMVFLWAEKDYRRMWMKNTLIPLDMLFINNDIVVSVYENAVPHSLELIGPDKFVDKVMELPAGYIKKHNIQKGWKIDISNIPQSIIPSQSL